MEDPDSVKLAANNGNRVKISNPDKVGPNTKLSERTRAGRPSRLRERNIAELPAHLTERDRRIALDCYEHHVLRTDQLKRLHFTGLRTASARLGLLYELRVLDRIRPGAPRGQGTMPYHWILDEAGAIIVADHKGIDPSQLHYTHADALRYTSSRNLTHHVEANEFFTRLAVDANHARGALSEWYGVRTLARMFAGTLLPDGYGVLTLPGRAPLHILLELDRGTESSQILREKAKRYAEILPRSSLRDLDPLVILAVPSARRAQTATAAIANTHAPVAVTVWNTATARSVLATVTTAAASQRIPPVRAQKI
jgi:hypothetical protein